MKGKWQKALSLICVLAGVLALAGLAVGVGGPAMAGVQATEKILVSLANDATALEYTLYTLNPDGSGQTKLFDFQDHPADYTGGIWQPRIAPGGTTIYFSSSNAYFWTPASRNLFRIASDGSWWDQITPDVNSGKWDQPGPYGIVEGTVEDTWGIGLSGAPIYLEGMHLKYSDGDGSFRFENVPEGTRWIVACKPGDCSKYDAQEILVASGAPWTQTLVPAEGTRMEHQYPAVYGNRIYHKLGIHQLVYTDVDASAFTVVHTVSGACSGIPNLDGFDVSKSGKLAIMDYWQYCPGHGGLYTADGDGGNMQLLVDMTSTDWSEAAEVFWSPDESMLASKVVYNSGGGLLLHVLIHDANTGALLGGMWFPSNYTIYNVDLWGWSPDGNWLLYSFWTDASKVYLHKIGVNNDGTLNFGSDAAVMEEVRLAGATWGNLETQTCAVPLTGVTISGPATGKPNTTYTFTANPMPANATSPTYSWSSSGLVSGQGTATARYSWSTEGTKSISVDASNCGGQTRSDDHNITISSAAMQQVFLPLTLKDHK